MIRKTFGFAALMMGATLTGCATTSQVDEQYGDSVRSTMAKQRIQPQPSDGTTPEGDGVRTESVLKVYRTTVGDPTAVGDTSTVTTD